MILSSSLSATEQLLSIRQLKSLEDGKKQIKLKNVSLLFMLNEFYKSIDYLLSKKNVKLIKNIEIDEHVNVYCAATYFINQILMNVCSNAIKFSNENDKIRLNVYTRGTKVFIEIQDFGIGMPLDLQKNIFELDQPTSQTGTAGEKGTGYGMPIFKYFMDTFHGKVQIHSVEGEGTVFTLSFNFETFFR